MRIRSAANYVEVEFIDAHCGSKKLIRLETCHDGERVLIEAKTYPTSEKEKPVEESGITTFSVVKAMAAALLLLEM